MTLPKVRRLAGLVLNVADLRRSRGFYVDALGFEPIGDEGAAGRVRLQLGAQEIVLAQAPPDAAPYPEPRAADDPWFQHFAIAVADMGAAYAHLLPHGPEPISRDGPELLPPSTGSVTAYKFRDPDGHPLELSFAPESAWAAASRLGGPLFQGIDHTALAVSDLEASVAFYTALGLQAASQTLNRGPEQDRLDGLNGVELDIASLSTPESGPHLELLHYRGLGPRTPGRSKRDDLATTDTVFTPTQPSSLTTVRDPDRHRLSFLEVLA